MNDNTLTALVRDMIDARGPITFAEFMRLVLYHPTLGYYSAGTEPVGPLGDFTTSPATHPAFAVLIACQLREMWDVMGRPSAFAVVEMGAGNGQLCRGVLAWLRLYSPAFYRRLRYILVEGSPRQRERQVAALARFRAKRPDIQLAETLEEVPLDGVEGCFLSNELVDAFPVHRVAMSGGRLREVYVTIADNRLAEVLGEPSTAALEERLRWLGVTLAEGNYAEINLSAPEWLRQVAARLRRGFVLTIDYGYEAVELYASARREGTLLSYRRHGFHTNALAHPGEQDLTAHVDFTTLVKTGLSAGLECAGLTTQQAFLMNLGLLRYAQGLRTLRLPAPELQANMRAMEELVQLDQLGQLKVLVQHKGLERPHLRGLGGAASGRGFESWRAFAALPRLRWRRPVRFL